MRSWLPTDMDDAEKDAHVEAATNPDGETDWHLAAALAWESVAASDQSSGSHVGVQSVSTGAQSVTYAGGTGPAGEAIARARWHRARTRLRSVPVGPEHEVHYGDWPTQPGWHPLGTGRV